MQYHHLPNKEDKQTKVHWPIRTIHVDQGQFHITNSHLEKAQQKLACWHFALHS